MSADIKLENPCEKRREFCVNCHNHFMMVRPSLKTLVISSHFARDLKNKEEINSIVNGVLNCSNANFNELHKFEEHIDGDLVFRAKKGGIHIVYCVDKKMRIVFLRAFRNYTEYGNFLNDRKEIKRMVANA
jgi:mRNA-degrading endonuclease RelE of RelBE toxin-antitoxin system